jgi:periplasmic protein TonB
MKVGISSDEWAHWFREPITQSLLFSLALHLAFVVVFQPAPGTSGRHTVVINARLQPAAAQSEPLPSNVEESVAAVAESKPEPSADLLTATTPSPAPPIPQSAAPVRVDPATTNSPPLPVTSPKPVSMPLASAASSADMQASVVPPAEKSRGGPQSTGLPSLPIGIDTTWYVARQVDNQPKAIGVIEPAYPEDAKRRNMEGTLKLMLKIDDLGRVQSAEVVEATPPGVFDDAALAAFRNAKFQPAMKEGRPVRYQAYFRVDFKLKD